MSKLTKWSKVWESARKRRKIILFGVPCLLVVALYFVSGKELELESFLSPKAYTGGGRESESPDGYLVWNPKCHMIDKDPLDRSIKKYIVKYKFEGCSSSSSSSSEPPMSWVSKEEPKNGSVALVVKIQSGIDCCWSPITRPVPSQPPTGDWDSKITVGKCVKFVGDRATLSAEIDTAMVTCRRGKKIIYKNIHAIINAAKVRERLLTAAAAERSGSGSGNESGEGVRKLSVLVLGIDSVSRLNFKRSMPKTEKYLGERDWLNLRGYNKIGENTFPNLMAILTGMNNAEAYARCKPTVAYGLDDCPLLWYDYKNSGYVTAYGEELASLSTFNYRKAGFVEPPTDYYLRPYVLAAEKLLPGKKRFGSGKYCTGPEISVERIFNYALEFARTFAGYPYFGFFWTNSMSHEDINGVSSMDERLRDMLEKMEREAITRDAMIVFLSDHGMRWGDIRQTFVGWYEERLPFIYIKMPDWFRRREPDAYRAMRTNENRLTSPYDLYETLRDVLERAGGTRTNVSAESAGCPECRSLFRPVAPIRGCSEAGISAHWCTCTAFRTASTGDKMALEATQKFLQHVENIIKHYRDENGKRLCSRLKLKKIHRVEKMMNMQGGTEEDDGDDGDEGTTTERHRPPRVEAYLYLIEVTPGGARYETTIRHYGANNFTINEDEISRINSYASTSNCLEHGSKRYCHCVRK